MKSKQAQRKSALISSSRWLTYATAGAASTIAGTHSAEGTIHYSGPIDQVFRQCSEIHKFQLDRPGDLIRLRHSQLGCSSYSTGEGLFNVAARAGASIAAFYSSRGVLSASNLKRGQFVSNRPFLPAQPSRSAFLGSEHHGQFQGGIGYIGFKFNDGSGDQYGWVRIQTRQEDFHYPFILLDYAYGDVGDHIRAGQNSSNEMVPDQGSLGLLALGAAGLLRWREKRTSRVSKTTYKKRRL